MTFLVTDSPIESSLSQNSILERPGFSVFNQHQSSDTTIKRVTPRFISQESDTLKMAYRSFLVSLLITTPLISFDPWRGQYPSGTSIVWQHSIRKGKKISLREAREIALQILADTERSIIEDQKNEISKLLISWD